MKLHHDFFFLPGVTNDILNKTASPTSSTTIHVPFSGATTTFGLFVLSKSSKLTLESCYQIAILVIIYCTKKIS